MTEHHEPKRTPLYDAHVERGAKVVDFHGFAMPVQYVGIQEEHRRVRTAAGLFDISHMGEFEVWGNDAFEFVQKVGINDAAELSTYQVQYNALCYEHGGLVDDMTVYRFPDHFMLVVNASNIEKDFAWLQQHVGGDMELRDRSDEYGLIALQGPRSDEVLAPLTETDLGRIGFYWFVPGQVAGVPTVISRTGYTGEDGFELYIEDREGLRRVWDALLEAGAGVDITPVGLGARDSLRLEVAYNLYGNDIWEETNPLEARMSWVTRLDKGDFLGRDALLRVKNEGLTRRLVGLELEGRVFPRQGYPILHEEREVGKVSSGTVAPSLNIPIALGYVPSELAAVGTTLQVDCRGRLAEGAVVRLPFYKEGSRK